MEDYGRTDLDRFSEIVEDAMDFPSWRDFVSRACEQPDLRQQFTAETGFKLPNPVDNGLEWSIDMSAAVAEHSRLFALWVTKRQYHGKVMPPDVREAVAGVQSWRQS